MKQPAIDDFSALIRKDRVHRRVYTDPAVFELEMERIFKRSWLFAAHESQAPGRGDFITTQLAGQTLIVVRHEDEVKALFNRCSHRGAKVCETENGNARPFRCPYHGWVFDTNGRNSYTGEGFSELPMRSQFAAWRDYMATAPVPG